MNKLQILSIEDLASAIYKRIPKNLHQSSAISLFDFAIIDPSLAKEPDLEFIESGVEGWYGIRQVDTGFDDTWGITLCVDYYGGGCQRIFHISEGYEKEDVYPKILKSIITSLQRGEGEFLTNETLLIVEERN